MFLNNRNHRIFQKRGIRLLKNKINEDNSNSYISITYRFNK